MRRRPRTQEKLTRSRRRNRIKDAGCASVESCDNTIVRAHWATLSCVLQQHYRNEIARSVAPLSLRDRIRRRFGAPERRTRARCRIPIGGEGFPGSAHANERKRGRVSPTTVTRANPIVVRRGISVAEPRFSNEPGFALSVRWPQVNAGLCRRQGYARRWTLPIRNHRRTSSRTD